MSVETLPRPTAAEETPEPSDSEQLELFDPTPDTEPVIDNREPSYGASRVRQAAERVATYLDRRAVDKVHGQANGENHMYDLHTEALSADETETAAAKERTAQRTAQEEAFATYEPNIAVTASREDYMARMEARAHSMNDAFDKNARREAREAKVAEATEKMKKLGHAVLNDAKLTVGLGLVAAESAKNSALNLMDSRQEKKATKRAARAEKKALAVRTKQNRIDARRTGRHARRDTPRNQKLATAQAKQHAAAQRAQAARSRIDARRV